MTSRDIKALFSNEAYVTELLTFGAGEWPSDKPMSAQYLMAREIVLQRHKVNELKALRKLIASIELGQLLLEYTKMYGANPGGL
jgi:hypothetical protein